MIDRINLIMKAKNITASQFADEINIQRSGMSHIMSGRNKPSLDFIMRVLKRYPEIDTDWLLFGKGEMYAPSSPSGNEPEKSQNADVANQDVVNQSYTADRGGQMDMFSYGMDEKPIETEALESVENQAIENSVISQSVENEVAVKTPEPSENLIKALDLGSGEEKPTQEKKLRKAVRYLVFYSDHTFEEFLRAEE